MNRGVGDASPIPLSSLELGRLRQGLYRLFGALFLYPDEDRLMALQAAAGALLAQDDAWAALPFADPLRRLLTALNTLDESLEVEEEHNRLFAAKPAAPPYESYYLDTEGQNRAWIANRVAHVYAEAGLALSPSLKELPDHVAVELELLSFLCGKEAEAWEAGEQEAGARARERQRDFLGQHLGRWFPVFTRRVHEARPEALYGAVIEAAYAFLRHELDLLQLGGVTS